MRDENIAPVVAIWCFALFLGVIGGMNIQKRISDKKWQRALAERGHAHYHPTTGKWEWKEEVK